MFFKRLREDIAFAKKCDPAARSKFEIYITYSGVHALSNHRFAHFLHTHKCKFLARCVSQFSKFMTGIEIHPGATIASGVFIDHGSGVVIGETAVVETGVVIYQNATLGGTGKDKGKHRHPTVKKGATISCGAVVLGNITIGENSIVGAGSVVLRDVPPNSTAVGVPARIVRLNGERIKEEEGISLTVQNQLDELKNKIDELQKTIDELRGKQ